MKMNNHHSPILVTQPAPQGQLLCALLAQQGIASLFFPTIALQPLPQTQFEQSLRVLPNQDWLIFVSPHAAKLGMAVIHKTYPSLPPSLQWAAVGEGTARVLQAAGQHDVHYPTHGEGSPALLAVPALQVMQGKQVMIIKGSGGRPLLQETLRARGAHVLALDLYERVLPTPSSKDYQALFDAAPAINMTICTSFEGAANLKSLLLAPHPSQPGAGLWSLFQHKPLLVVSERIKQLVLRLGFQRVWVADGANHHNLLQALWQFREEKV